MAIATIYRGIEYRSRLEARYAAFFHGLGWHFTYEPLDGNGYIPDFLIHGDRPLMVEVKPAVTWSDYTNAFSKVSAGLTGHWNERVLILGADPLPAIDSRYDTYPVAGAMFEHYGEDDKEGWSIDGDEGNIAYWAGVPQEGIWSEYLSWARSPSGEIEKPWAAGGGRTFDQCRQEIQGLWAAATNDVKWRGRAA